MALAAVLGVALLIAGRISDVDYLFGATLGSLAAVRLYQPLYSHCDWYPSLHPHRRRAVAWMSVAVISPWVWTMALGDPDARVLIASTAVTALAVLRLEAMRREVQRIRRPGPSRAELARTDLNELRDRPLPSPRVNPRGAFVVAVAGGLLLALLYNLPGEPDFRFPGAAATMVAAGSLLVFYGDADRGVGRFSAALIVLLPFAAIWAAWLLAIATEGGVVVPATVVVPLLLATVVLGQRGRRT